MILLSDSPEGVEELGNRSKSLVERLFTLLKDRLRAHNLTREEHLSLAADEIYFVESGVLSLYLGENRALIFDDKDVVAAQCYLNLDGARIEADFPTTGYAMTWKELESCSSTDPVSLSAWLELLRTQLQIQTSLATASLQKVPSMKPEVLHFSSGERIIEEGQATDEIFTLVEGRAEVTVEGVRVGEVREDEIFGATAALTESRRTASVFATTECTVMSTSKEQFLELIKAKPRTALKLVATMAHTIVQLNSAVVASQRRSR